MDTNVFDMHSLMGPVCEGSNINYSFKTLGEHLGIKELFGALLYAVFLVPYTFHTFLRQNSTLKL